jgi:hypothetical protein
MVGNPLFDPQNYLCASYDSNNKEPFSPQRTLTGFKGHILLCLYISFLLNPSKHNINEICIITFNGALLHVSAPGSHHQAKYNKPIANYRIACYIISALELDSYIHIQ